MQAAISDAMTLADTFQIIPVLLKEMQILNLLPLSGIQYSVNL